MRGVHVVAAPSEAGEAILSESAIEFVAHLVRRFRPGLENLMAKRVIQQERYDAGEKPRFLPETQPVRDGDWKVDCTPSSLLFQQLLLEQFNFSAILNQQSVLMCQVLAGSERQASSLGSIGSNTSRISFNLVLKAVI